MWYSKTSRNGGDGCPEEEFDHTHSFLGTEGIGLHPGPKRKHRVGQEAEGAGETWIRGFTVVSKEGMIEAGNTALGWAGLSNFRALGHVGLSLVV